MLNENVQNNGAFPSSESVDELKQRLFDQLAEYGKAELESLKLEKYKTGKLWDIGD